MTTKFYREKYQGFIVRSATAPFQIEMKGRTSERYQSGTWWINGQRWIASKNAWAKGNRDFVLGKEWIEVANPGLASSYC
jgi:hypothetical protein